MMRVSIGAAVLLALCVVMAGCGVIGRRGQTFALPSTPAYAECEQYAVVTAAHVLLYREPLYTADLVYLFRRGELLLVVDKDIDQKQYYAQQAPWYLLRLNGARGWGFGGSIATHCYQYQAELQQQLLKKKYVQ